MVTPSDRGLAGIGMGRTAWQLRLRALRWAEFQVAAHKAKSKTEAYERVAGAFARSVETVKEWRSRAAKEFGTAVVAEALEMSRRLGEWTQEIHGQAALGTIDEREHQHVMAVERAYGDQALKALAARFSALPRKKQHGGGK